MVTKFKAKCLPRWSAGSSVRLVFSDLHDAISTLHIVSQSTSQQTTQPNNQLTNEPTTTPPIATTITHSLPCMSSHHIRRVQQIQMRRLTWQTDHRSTNKQTKAIVSQWMLFALFIAGWVKRRVERKEIACKKDPVYILRLSVHHWIYCHLFYSSGT